jgi:hypothetical protein
MPTQTRIVSPGPSGAVRTPDGQLLTPPADWTLVPPGDALLTRRLKAAGPTWTVQEKKGRKTFSRGVWTSAATVERIRSEVAAERATPQYAKRQATSAVRRDKEQTAYVETFAQAVLNFLAFAPRHADVAENLARAVADHATPVGSGTVARTRRIPVEERAQAAVIAWLRHQTTAYDHMTIPRERGKRREVRRMLADRSRALLAVYRAGRDVPSTCPLQRALSRPRAEAS